MENYVICEKSLFWTIMKFRRNSIHTGHFLERILQIHTTSTHFLRRKLRVSLGKFNIAWKLLKLAFKKSNNFHLGHRSSSSPPGGPFSHMCPFSPFRTHFRTICIFSSDVFFCYYYFWNMMFQLCSNHVPILSHNARIMSSSCSNNVSECPIVLQ